VFDIRFKRLALAVGAWIVAYMKALTGLHTPKAPEPYKSSK